MPKTGGTSISKALRPFGLVGEGHRRLEEIRRNFKLTVKQLGEYYIFASIRNPWDLVVSNYFYIRKGKTYWHSIDGTTKYGLHPDYLKVSRMTFNEFVKALCCGYLEAMTAYTPQKYWIPKNTNYIIRYEHIQEDFQHVCEALKIPRILLPKLNGSEHSHYSMYYNEETKEAIRKYYVEDIDKYNYEYEKSEKEKGPER